MRRIAMVMRIFVALLIVMAGMSSHVLAVPSVDSDAPVQLSVKFGVKGTVVPGAQFDLYHVGTLDAGGGASLFPEYAATYVIDDPTSRKGWARLARQMADGFEADKVEALESVVTNASGHAAFGEKAALQQGVYLVVGHDTKVGDYTYSSLPYLVSLPLWDEETGSWTYDVATEPKASVTGGETPPPPEPKPKPTPTPDEKTHKWLRLPKTGEELSYWLSYAIIGLALVEVGMWLRKRKEADSGERQ